MTRITLTIITAFLVQSLLGQDKIYTKNKQELIVKIVEQTDMLIKYKMTDYTDSPILSIKINRVEKIEYKNGIIDLVGNQNPRHYKPFGFNMGTALFLTTESGILFFNIDYFIIPQISIEANMGISDFEEEYFSFGSKFHLNTDYSDNKFTPFIGALIGSEFGTGMIQMPLGINYISKKGLNAALSISKLLYFDSWQETLMELRFGWRF